MSAQPNAIERRLDKLDALWNEFAEHPDFRLGRWLIGADERRMLDAFIEVQTDESGSLPDLFIRFEEPFAEQSRHGVVLAESLKVKYEEIREGIAKEGLPSDWRSPAVDSKLSDAANFAKCLTSLHAHYEEWLRHVVAVLMPDRFARGTNWPLWLQQLLKAGLPSGARIMVLDDASSPVLEELAKAEAKLVKTIEPKLDMPTAYLELAKGTGKGGPGVSFRLNFVALTQTAATGDVAKAKQLAATAMTTAQQQGWPQLQAVVQMTLASVLVGAKKSAEAIACYRNAAAAVAAKPNDPATPKILLQSKLSEGGVLFSDGKHAEAAKVYEESAAMAEQQQNYLMAMESWRMAGHCHEAGKQLEAGWRCGNKALDAASKMEPDLRASSTLPFVGQLMLRLAKGADPEYDQQVRTRMKQLAGADWEKKLEAASAPA